MNAKRSMANSIIRVAGALVAVAVVTGCRSAAINTITQISTADVLERGDLRGRVVCNDLRRYGDFGYGVGERLEGQCILLDGRLHHVGADGRLDRPPAGASVAFASVSRFQWDQAITIRERTDLKKLGEAVSEVTGGERDPCALKLRGRFLEVRLFTLEATQTGRVSYKEAAGKRPVMAHEDIAGTILGYRMPSYMDGLVLPGYRLFFLSESLEFGGEVVDFTLQEGVTEIDTCSRLQILLGTPAAR